MNLNSAAVILGLSLPFILQASLAQWSDRSGNMLWILVPV
jgi:hypothetical protein